MGAHGVVCWLELRKTKSNSDAETQRKNVLNFLSPFYFVKIG